MAEPSHVDLSVLWVPIMPETSRLGPEMEKAGKDATESFGKGSEKLGEKITDSISKSKDKIQDVFKRTGSDASESVADGVKQNSKKVEDALGETGKKARGKFRETVGDLGKEMVNSIGPDVKRELTTRVEDVVGGAFKTVLGDSGVGGIVGDSVSKGAGALVGSWLDSLKDKANGVKDAAGNTRKAFADFSSGDTVGGVSKLVDSFHKIGLDVKDLPGPLGDAVTKLGEAKTAAQTFSDIFKDLPGKIGQVGTAIEGLAGPFAVAMQSQKDMDDFISRSGHPELVDPNIKGDQYSNMLQGELRQLAAQGYKPGSKVSPPKPPPGVDMSGVSGIGKGGDVLGSGSDAYDFFSSNQSLPTPPSETAPAPAPSSIVGGSSVSASSPKDLHRAGSNVANLYRLANALQGTPYSQALRNDCSGMVSKLATAALGMDPSVQFSTVNEGDWLFSHGFQPGMGPEGSLRIGWYDHGGGNAGHTAATLPGGEHAESGGSHGAFLVGPGAAGADDPQFSMHAWLPMQGGAGSERISSSFGSGSAPSGTAMDPLYVLPANAAGGGGGGGSIASSFGGGAPAGRGGGLSMPDFLGGAAEGLGLDGSVFHGFGGASNPMNFGAVKLGTGLLRALMPMIGGRGASRRAGTDHSVPGDFAPASHGIAAPMQHQYEHPFGATPTGKGPLEHFAASGGSSFGGVDLSSPGGMIEGGLKLADALFSDLNPGTGAKSAHDDHAIAPMPNPGQDISNSVVPAGRGGGGGNGQGDTHNHYYGDVGGFTVNQQGVQDGVQSWHDVNNSSGRTAALTANLPGQ